MLLSNTIGNQGSNVDPSILTNSQFLKDNNHTRNRRNRTVDKTKKKYVKQGFTHHSRQTQRYRSIDINIDKSSGKLMNLEMGEFLLPIQQQTNKIYGKMNVEVSFNNRIQKSDKSSKCKNSDIKQIHKKGRNIKIITRIKNPAEDNSIIKKYMCIEQIKLPTPRNTQNSECKLRNSQRNQLSMQSSLNSPVKQIKSRVERLREFKTSKTHRRNRSSIPEIRQKAQLYLNSEEITMNKFKQQFSIRKPVLRKDYFVFGLSDRITQQNKLQYFRDYLWKINYSNSLYVNTPEQVHNSYKVFVGPGNNSHLIRAMMRKRFWWTIVDKLEDNNYSNINFIWTQLKQNNYFKNQKNCQIQQIQNSTILVRLPEQEQFIQDDDHKKIFNKTDLMNWNRYYVKHRKVQQKIVQKTYFKRLSLFKLKSVEYISNSENLKVHNHLENNFYIGNKKALFYNMRRYLTLKGIDPFTILPLTFHITKGVEDPEYKLFSKYYDQIEANKTNDNIKNVWIVKPGENTNRGNGITVCYNFDDIIVRLKGRQRNSDGKLRTFIIQKYIEKPLLYQKRKFDIRHYMLISCINGRYKAYWYEEGYIRTSSYQYNLKGSRDPQIHLTNDAIQKNNQSYGKFQRGNKLSYADFQKYLDGTSKIKKVNFFYDILPKMKEMATESVRASYQLLDQNRKYHNFELLGLDFMIDEEFNPWLIEINTNPCLEICSSLLEKIIPQLIDNVLKICVDPLYPPPEAWQINKKLYFGDSPLNQNKFELIFDEVTEGKQIEKLYEGTDKLDERMGKIEEDDEMYQNDGDQNWDLKK